MEWMLAYGKLSYRLSYIIHIYINIYYAYRVKLIHKDSIYSYDNRSSNCV